MAYTILNNSGAVLLRLADDAIDQSTSVTFVGKDYAGWGQYYNQNLVTLLTNSANPNYGPPANPVGGQLWYDTTYKKLRVFDASSGTFISAGGATVGNSQPAGLNAGDFWYNNSTATQTLNFYNGISFVTVPTFPYNQPSGWIVPLSPVTDNSPVPVRKQITLLENYGSVVGAINSQPAFTVNPTQSMNIFNTSSYTLTQGLSVIGNIQVSGSFISPPATIPQYNPQTAGQVGVPGQILFSNPNMYICWGGTVWGQFGPDNVNVIYLGSPPAHSYSAGNAGQVAWDSSYFYICTGTNTWSRIGYTSSNW
jgi:hypothetical protein